MIVHQHHYAIVHEHSYRLVHQQQKNPLHQQSRWWSGFFCRSWTCFLGPFLNKIVGQEPHLLVHEQLYGIVPELAFISRCWNPPNSLADYLQIILQRPFSQTLRLSFQAKRPKACPWFINQSISYWSFLDCCSTHHLILTIQILT